MTNLIASAQSTARLEALAQQYFMSRVYIKDGVLYKSNGDELTGFSIVTKRGRYRLESGQS